MFVPFEYDIQVLLYFLHSQFPTVQTELGEDEIKATMIESGVGMQKTKKYDLKIRVSNKLAASEPQQFITLKYFYSAQRIKLSWLTSPSNDLVADSVCLLLLEIKERATPQLVKMLELTKQGRKKQELQMKVHHLILNHFANVEETQGRLKINADQSEFVIVDLEEMRIIESQGSQGAAAIETDLREIFARATESQMPCAISHSCVSH